MDKAHALAAAWRAAYGPLPEDYTVLDLETTGFSADYDSVVQIGWLRAVGGREVERGSVAVDWTQSRDAHAVRHIAGRLETTSRKMREAGKTHAWTMDRLRAEGRHPAEVADRLGRLIAGRPILVGHNLWRFDIPMLDRFVASVRGVPLGVPPNQCLDTAAMVKAAQSGAVPRPGETYRDYALRATAAGGSRYRSSLDDFCVRRFRLARRFGVDPALTHDAAYDCYLCHLVYEDLRRLVATGRLPADEPAPGPRPEGTVLT